MATSPEAHEHRTDPEPEPVRPGVYVSTETGWQVRVTGMAERMSSREHIVFYLGLDDPGRVWWEKEPIFRRYFTRLPDAPQGAGNG